MPMNSVAYANPSARPYQEPSPSEKKALEASEEMNDYEPVDTTGAYNTEFESNVQKSAEKLTTKF